MCCVDIDLVQGVYKNTTVLNNINRHYSWVRNETTGTVLLSEQSYLFGKVNKLPVVLLWYCYGVNTQIPDVSWGQKKG